MIYQEIYKIYDPSFKLKYWAYYDYSNYWGHKKFRIDTIARICICL